MIAAMPAASQQVPAASSPVAPGDGPDAGFAEVLASEMPGSGLPAGEASNGEAEDSGLDRLPGAGPDTPLVPAGDSDLGWYALSGGLPAVVLQSALTAASAPGRAGMPGGVIVIGQGLGTAGEVPTPVVVPAGQDIPAGEAATGASLLPAGMPAAEAGLPGSVTVPSGVPSGQGLPVPAGVPSGQGLAGSDSPASGSPGIVGGAFAGHVSVPSAGSASPVPASAAPETHAAAAATVAAAVQPAPVAAALSQPALVQHSDDPAASGTGLPQAPESAVVAAATGGALAGQDGRPSRDSSSLAPQPGNSGDSPLVASAASGTQGVSVSALLSAPTGPQPAVPARAVPDEAVELARQGGGRVTLVLTPEGLGRVVLTVGVGTGGVSVTMTGTPEAIAAVGRNGMETALLASGMQVARIEMSTASSGQPASDQPRDQRDTRDRPSDFRSGQDRGQPGEETSREQFPSGGQRRSQDNADTDDPDQLWN